MPFLEVGELRTHYALQGEKEHPVLVMSNSLGTDFTMWDAQLEELSRGFRVLLYDTRGQGQSRVTPGDYTIGQLGRDVVGLLDALGLDRVNFCGLSMGGMIGIWLGIHAGGRLRRLVVSNTAACIGTKETWNSRIETVRRDGMKPVAAAVVERWFTPGFRARSVEQVARTRQMLEDSPPEGYVSCCAAVRDMDQREEVAEIKVPTLVIYGSHDPVIPVADAQFLADRIQGSEQVELPAAHLSSVEQPAAFTEAVREFLSR